MFARTGLITADITVTENGILVHSPLCFDEAPVTLEDVLVPTQDIEDALGQVYQDNYAAWCARLDAERAQRAEAEKPRRRSFLSSNMHHPCPTLWAGR